MSRRLVSRAERWHEGFIKQINNNSSQRELGSPMNKQDLLYLKYTVDILIVAHHLCQPNHRVIPHHILSGAIIGDGDRKSWDARGPMIWDNFSIFRTNCAILTSYIRANPRTCHGFSHGCCHVAGSNVESC